MPRVTNSERKCTENYNNTHTHPFNGPLSRTTQVGRYQKGTTNLDCTGARDSEWQWHQLGRMQVCTSFQIDNHASTPPLRFLQAGWCRPAYGPADATANHCLVSVKSRLVLPFWYRLTRAVPGKGPLNGCVRVRVVDLLTD